MPAKAATAPARELFIESGYHIWPGFLSGQQANMLLESANRLLADSSALHTPESVRSFDLHQRDVGFASLLSDDRLRMLVHELLGQGALLSDLSINQIRQHGKADRWHIDYPYGEMPEIVSGGVLAIQCVLPLSPFTATSGATQLIRGSNRSYCHPPTEVAEEPFKFLADPGDLLILSAATWHRAGVNSEARPRTAVLLNFTESWIKPMRFTAAAGSW
jgi:ectoine hydroxylase-related dioxygenase (phytanoyl-CoA dioxygenase family)